jgi:DNA-binding CsgD family transcriptional regulator
MLKQALRAFRAEEITRPEDAPWLWLAFWVASDLWDNETCDLLSTRHLKLVRDAGALTVLPIALSTRIYTDVFAGELTLAASLIEEAQAVTQATGSQLAPYGALHLLAVRGREAEASELIQLTTSEVERRGEGYGLTVIEWASAVLYNSLGRYEEALVAARVASEHATDLAASTWALAELVVAAVRSGKYELASDAYRRLSETTRASGTEWALGIEARSRALLRSGATSEDLYREAIDRLSRTNVRVELARAHLLYGEWLRRGRRRLDARDQLHTAHEMFATMGAEAFATRAERELRATGEHVRKRTVETQDNLTGQEEQIAKLASEGSSNPEIAAQLFISPRTVEYHLHKVFTKLTIGSRHQLTRALASRGDRSRLA